MGLGLLGGGFNVVKFLAEQNAKLIVTDLKDEKQLKSSIKKLQKFKNIKFVLEKHRLQDFRNRDLIIKASGVPLDSIYIREARKNNIPIEMDAAFFKKLARKFFKDITIIGVTGTRGKSTVTHLLFEIIKAGGKNVFLGGNVKGLATLPLLNKIKDGSIIVMELASWNLQGFGYNKMSPNIAVFTTFFDDHLNYYKGDRKLYFKDKSNIFKYQKKSDFLIMPVKTRNVIKKYYDKKMSGKIKICDGNDVFKKWDVKILGEHNLQNISLAVQVAKILGIDENIIKQTVENFRGVSGRLEFVKEINGAKYYNDTTSTMPDSTIAALRSFGEKK
ncbi:UDP-N-acetylmuramoyl-L-alanine--D-glutamate ligase, partial [bacterium]